ncbi:MAG TPA: 23S rRNA (guanosine(2251)-2'-O)-methyltransferase RlmB [Acidiphilium sp.]|uniref:23S rRNA (guanosine(2251)-2'-O)-methyltransferase RlmB n=1 Tax=unclassified Acidiphilium TaxID=2617493 RepID=UPI000BCEB548|nr:MULTISPECIES: 23S rRNA (guanosine(2251)-2'-O)-methyltransferase RlmB [unclassified Acidiphilium]OYV55724.1 MAG: 23S rRNA (guanosine(2251)-2'-O)-methyltransferase RlmB [Acidiphilium sp. 20-67-58]HQT60770.1 23S rRNA (guanosine(2251)-2'-O)-methyltransferase RlmB [Acidiphilium sp.]HQU10688.1 23S rRNA (guanosine(2251)-2'-O)-methyltransferase RlmB [Acidiphilium sp.]
MDRRDNQPHPRGGRTHKHNRTSPPQGRGHGDVGRERRPQAAGGGFWLYGLHPVEAALANPARRLRRLLVTEEGEATLAARLPQPWAIQPERVERDRLEHMLGRGIVHQGIALQTDPLVAPTLADALKRPGPVLVLDQITDPRNVGAILRSAQAFGAAMVIAQERNAPEEGGALAKAASGALERMPLLRTVNIARALIALKAAGLWVMGLDAAGTSFLSRDALGGRRAALVLGAEGEGLRRLTRETCDELVSLPMPGGMESLNVSAAAAVALYEIIR